MKGHDDDFPRKYLRELSHSLHHSGFETPPMEDGCLLVQWNDAPLCRISGKGSVFYRREDIDKSGGEDALLCVEDIAAQTLAYMAAMETAPQLKASGLEGDYRILADFGGAVLCAIRQRLHGKRRRRLHGVWPSAALGSAFFGAGAGDDVTGSEERSRPH